MQITIVALVISICYLFAKFIESKWKPEAERKPLKLVIYDACFVYLSVVAGFFIYNQSSEFMLNGGVVGSGSIHPQVFAGEAEF